jgi:DNA modification methylase
MATHPKDLGYDMEGYTLHELKFFQHEIITQAKIGVLFNEGNCNATNFNAEIRATQPQRLAKTIEIVKSIPVDESLIIWIKHNDEGEELKRLFKENNIDSFFEIKGSDTNEWKKEKALGFANGKYRILISKAKMLGYGMNFQSCHNQIFASPDFSFETTYQAIRRSYRFGQEKAVNIHIVITDTMENIQSIFLRKQKQFLEMQNEMNKNINSKQYGLVNEYEFKEYKEPNFHIMKGDSCIEIKKIPDNSVDLIIFSPPFSSLFTYSNYIHDMGNNDNHYEFFKQYAFLLKDLYRILKPGRLMCCHTKNLGVYKNSSGYTGVYPFTIEHTQHVLADSDFKLHCDPITIWCDPVLEMQRTKTQRLLYKTVRTDSSFTGTGMCETITVFKKWEGNQEEWTPIRNLNKDNFPLEAWQRWASPVWMDIKRTDVLNNSEGTDMGDEKHIAPLQLEVINRLVNLWSNEGETIFTPFLGIGSEVYQSLKCGRKGIGIELKDSYFETAYKNLKKAERKNNQISLF